MMARKTFPEILREVAAHACGGVPIVETMPENYAILPALHADHLSRHGIDESDPRYGPELEGGDE